MFAKPLRKGDIIAVYSPSSPASAFAKARFERAKAYLSDKGYIIKEGPLTGQRDFYRSGSIQERVDELNALIRDPEVRCIMSMIGGMNSNSLLPYLDYEAIKKDPKIFVGYSDVTALLLGIYAKTGLVTYYGPALVASFGELPPYVDETFASFEAIVSGNIQYPYPLPTPKEWTEEYIDWSLQDRSKHPQANQLITVHPGRHTGRLIGGNLNTMGGIWGSEYMPEIKQGDILLIEDSLKDIATLERNFAHLKINGVFDCIGGLILGKHELFKDMGTGRRPYELLLEVIGEPTFPILAEFDCAHTHPMLTLPIGVLATLDADKQELILEGRVSES